MYSAVELVAKRAFDITVASVGLVLCGPLLAAAGLVVRVSSPGPVIFGHERVGRAGKPFTLYKLRTMRGSVGSQVTVAGDKRVTPVGKILRRTKIDELPGLFNVLSGDLSLVGPRPEVRKYVDLYPPSAARFIQRFRPGITDPGSLLFRNEEEILAHSADPERAYIDEVLPKKVELYVEYLQRASFVSDVRVLVKTLAIVCIPALAPR